MFSSSLVRKLSGVGLFRDLGHQMLPSSSNRSVMLHYGVLIAPLQRDAKPSYTSRIRLHDPSEDFCGLYHLAERSHGQFRTIIMSAFSPIPHIECNLHSKSPRRNRHSPHQRRRNTSPEASHPFPCPRLRKSIPHTLVLLLCPESIRLHFRLDDVERV